MNLRPLIVRAAAVSCLTIAVLIPGCASYGTASAATPGSTLAEYLKTL